MRVRILSSLVIVIASIVSLYFYKDYTDKNAIKKAQLEQKNKIKTENQNNIAKMVANYNAIDWESELFEKYKKRSIKLYSRDIQRLWITERPILFIGALKDISDYNDNTYLLRIKRYFTLRHLPIVLPGNDFELSLLANKSYIDKFLDDNNGLRSNKGHKYVAVIASIKSVDTKNEIDEDSEIDVYTGNGNLLSLYYIDGPI